jgi:phospholipid/cholesterol/gamma-HCH transport system substrate-binding protein
MSPHPEPSALARRVWIATAAIAVIAIALIAVRSRQQPHAVHASFQSAVDLTVGDDVDLAGIPVGRVSAVSYENGRADVTLGIDDGPAWPLRRGATAALRFGTTIGVATRRIDLTQGPAGAPPIADGGIIPTADTTTPVEWDQVFGIFNGPTRTAERVAAREGARVLAGRAGDLNRGIEALASGTGAASGVLADLASDRALLARLVPATDQVTGTLAAHAARISALVLVAQQTLGTFSARMQSVKAALASLPGTLTETTTTLRRLDRSATQLQPTLAQLAPGARQLRTFGRYLHPALSALASVAPAGVRAADSARAATAPIATLLPTLGSFLGADTTPVLSRLDPMLACVVPYAPEIAGFLSNWDSWDDHRLGAADYGRYHIIEGSSLSGSPPLNTVLAARVPGIHYARALAPGQAAGAPWELSQCGYSGSLGDPSLDPQNGR